MSDELSPGDESQAVRPRTFAQRIGEWLLKDREAQDADLAKLMRYNILISFLCLMSVAGEQTLNFALTHLPL